MMLHIRNTMLIFAILGSLSTRCKGQDEVSTAEMQKAMASVKNITQPGKAHKLLERFLGQWETETRFFMGGKATPASKGTANIEWLMKGRWVAHKMEGTMMGQPVESFAIFGYDNMKKSYVVTAVSTMDTAMIRSEGDTTPDGTLILWGQLDEYLTGEHDKTFKTIWRFPADDEMIMEIHDLQIGESNTKVAEVSFKRSQ